MGASGDEIQNEAKLLTRGIRGCGQRDGRECCIQVGLTQGGYSLTNRRRDMADCVQLEFEREELPLSLRGQAAGTAKRECMGLSLDKWVGDRRRENEERN